MAHERKIVPKDPPEVIAIKTRMQPVDRTVAKASRAWNKEWEYGWFKNTNYRLAEISSEEGGGWIPITKDEKGIEFPFAVGDKTDDFYHNLDTIACKRPKELGNRRRYEKAYYEQAFIEGRVEEFKETAGRAGLPNPDKNIELTITEGSDAAQITQ